MIRTTGKVLGVPIDAISMSEAVGRVLSWAEAKESRYVAICNSHVVVTAHQDPEYGDLISNSDMATPDGAPVAWMLRRLGFKGQRRLCGPDLMLELCAQCSLRGIKIFCYGGTAETLDRLGVRLKAMFPALEFGGFYSPPFRTLSPEEDEDAVSRINRSESGIVFVGLGCPKQERWMADHYGRVQGVMIGVGAAFDFHAGTIKRAPLWVQKTGFEWLHRLCSEPRRLWKRYLVTNTLFIYGALRQILKLV